jgi:hypothetical protein
MSFGSPISPFDPGGDDWWLKGSSGLAKQLCFVSHFLRDFRVYLRFGYLTRAPLRLLRFQVKECFAECDWIARAPDPWDADLLGEIGKRHAAMQALKDAIDTRSLLFATLPDLTSARLRVYRDSPVHSRELIIVGNVRRNEGSFRGVHSLAMRAKLIGFRFSLEDDFLCRLSRDESLCTGD